MIYEDHLKCAVATVVAIALASFSFAEETAFDKLTITTNDWFSIAESASSGGGTWTLAGQATTLDWVGETGSKVAEFDTDLTSSDSLQYATPNKVDSIYSFKLRLESAPVKAANLPTVGNSGSLVNPKTAFAVKKCDDSSLKYVAFIGSAWQELSGATPPAAGEQFDLEVTLDGRGASIGIEKVQYAIVNGNTKTILSYNTQTWFDCLVAGTVGNVGFCGAGSFKTLAGKTHTVTEEKIAVSVGSQTEMTISEADMTAMKLATGLTGADSGTVATELAKTNSYTSRTYAEDYTLGIWKNDNGTMTTIDNGELLMKGNATAASDSEVKLTLNAIPPSAGKVGYQLKGSDDNSSWENVGDEQTDANALSIPLTGGAKIYKFYKVDATIK